ncbi:MAG: TraR/DksA family transcriptional regulator [Gammaproteobacteria bacterium]|nr:TraR/DksA family transcriptional regulator [Gammaproteobacteria bacterium]
MIDYQSYKNQLENLRNDYTRRVAELGKDIHHTEEPVEKDFSEQATQLENSEVLNALDDEARSALIQIDNALFRLSNNSFGICEKCGGNINEKRLRAIPYASLCIKCAEQG